MSTQAKPFLTEEEYLEIERKAERKSEYHDGQMFAMSGASFRHAEINGNVVAILRRELAGSPCREYFTELRVRIASTGLYTYPDVLVICGEPEFARQDPDTVTNPKLLIEILSPSTERYDRGDKFADYRTIPSLCDYLVIAQKAIWAEHSSKRPDGSWVLRQITDPDAIITLESINVRFPLKDAYDNVRFSA